jgi:hypothetical protein
MDGDVIHLRAKKVFFDVDYNKKEWKVYWQEDMVNGLYPLSQFVPYLWPIVANLLGSDYHAHVKNVGFQRVQSFLEN